MSPQIFRSLTASLLVIVKGGAMAIAPAAAQESGAYYRAELAQTLAQPQTFITDGIVWKCEGSTCEAAKNNSREVVVCARLAKKAGQVTSFSSRKTALEAEAIARCNKG